MTIAGAADPAYDRNLAAGQNKTGGSTYNDDMDKAPQFLVGTLPKIQGEEAFQPAKPNRRGEILAWTCCFTLAVTAVVQAKVTAGFPYTAVALLAFFFLAGATTSFGNWLERRTSVLITPEGVTYASPIRNVSLAWEKVDSLAALPAGQGWRLVVQGAGRLFQFRTPVPPGEGGREAVPIGFPDGERMAGLIRSCARLSAPMEEEEAWVCRKKGSSPAS